MIEKLGRRGKHGSLPCSGSRMSGSKPYGQQAGHGDEHPEEGDEVSEQPRPREDPSPGRGEVIGGIHQPTRHDEDKTSPGEPGKIVEDRHRTEWPLLASNE